MFADQTDVYPNVEFGWRIGWDCDRDNYYQHPYLFITWWSNPTGYQCRDLDASGDRVFMNAASWQWYTIKSDDNGHWSTYYTGNIRFKGTPYVTFYSGWPIIMNAERHCGPVSCNDTTNWGNFDRIREATNGNWVNIVAPTTTSRRTIPITTRLKTQPHQTETTGGPSAIRIPVSTPSFSDAQEEVRCAENHVSRLQGLSGESRS
ncbi:MAG: hypothetical protein ABR518_09465 [Actinomycetota bacterium]